MKNSWEIARHFIFRCAGFPFEWIERIQFPSSYHAVVQSLINSPDSPYPNGIKKIFKEEIFKKRFSLQQIASDPRFQDAILHQNQKIKQDEAYQRILDFSQAKIRTEERNRDSRRKELLVYRYLQRFCARNETVSFFGPFYIGSFKESKDKIFLKRGSPGKIKGRKVYISLWLIEEIVKRIMLDDKILAKIKPRLSPRIYLKSKVAVDLQSHKRFNLDRLSVRVIELLKKDNRNIKKIISQLKQEGVSPQKALTKIRRFIDKGILLAGLEITNKTEQPIEYLIGRLSGNAAAKNNRWCIALQELGVLRDSLEKGNSVKRLGIITKLNCLFLTLLKSPRCRDLKSNKGFFTEYCELNLKKLNLNRNILYDLQDKLSLILNLTAFNQSKIDKIKSSLLADWLRKNFTNRNIPIKEVIYKILSEKNQKKIPFQLSGADISSSVVDNLPSDFLDFIDSNKKNRLVRFRQENLTRRFEPYLDSLNGPAATCADIFISAKELNAVNKGNYKIVFGEAHNQRKPLSVYRWMQEASTKGKFLTSEIENIHKNIKKHYLLGDFLTVARDVLDRGYNFSTLCDVEYGAYSERKKDKLNFSSLTVSYDNNEVSLNSLLKKNPVLLLTPIPALDSLFSLPSPCFYPTRLSNTKDHFPRIEIENFVFQREQWVIPKDELFFAQDKYTKSEIELWIELEKWRRKEGVPKQFFVKTASRGKPVFIDFLNYFAVETFRDLCKKSRERILIIEMLPGPKDLWFKDKEGRYTCEFRLILYKK